MDTRFWIIFLSLELIVILQGVFSYKSKLFTMSQLKLSGFKTGLPFNQHVGMWLDLIAISWVIAYVYNRYSHQWSTLSQVMTIAASAGLSLFMNWFYLQTSHTSPSCHVSKGKTTAAGWLHNVYMAYGTAVLLLFYWNTKDVSLWVATVITIVLLLHYIITIVVPKLIVREPINTPKTISQMTVGSLCILISFAYVVH